MNYQTLGLGLVIAAVAFTGAFAGSKRPAVVERIVEKTVGAVTGPDSFFPCETHDGIQRCFTRYALVISTTTPCTIQSPSGTSTLIAASIKIDTATSVATTIHVAKSTLRNATTTLLNSAALASGARGTLLASTTGEQAEMADSNIIFAPNNFLNFGVFGGTGTSDNITGVCQATFEVI